MGEIILEGEPDWGEVWKARMLRNQFSSHGGDLRSFFSGKESGTWYDSNVRVDDWGDEEGIGELSLESPGSRALVIGAGHVNLAIRLAGKVNSLTCVEYRGDILEYVEDRIKEQGICNVTLVKKKWCDVKPGSDMDPQYDIVVAPFSLGMKDIEEAIRKMDRVSSRYVHIYWFAGMTALENTYMDLWPIVHGERYYPPPKCECLYNLLCQMGIYPNVNVYPVDNVYAFSGMDEAARFFMTRVNASTPEQEEKIREYLRSVLSIDLAKRRMLLKGYSRYVDMWWDKKLI